MKQTACQNISPYIRNEASVLAEPRTSALSAPLEMFYGNKRLDGGYLELDNEKADMLRAQYPELDAYILKLVGGKELLSGKWKHCFWLKDAPKEILANPEVRLSINKCREWREKRRDATCQRLAKMPHICRDNNRYQSALLIPRVCNADREYIPMAFIDADTVTNDQVQIVPNADLYVFGVASSKMHLAWIRAVCGGLQSGIRYSKDVCWNTFPWPSATTEARQKVMNLAQNVLKARKTVFASLGDMYRTGMLDASLTNAHKKLDKAVDTLYRNEGFASDSERMNALFSLYARMTEHSSNEGIGRWF